MARLEAQIARRLDRVPDLVAAPLAAETVLLGPLLDDVRLVATRSHPERKVEVEVTLEPGLAAAGDREALEELFGALVDNAVRWARRRVLIAGDAAGGSLCVTVADDGPGLLDGAWEAALRPGARLDASGPGHGLGLASAAELARALGGSLSHASSRIGGLTVEVTLRRRQASET